MKNKIYKICGVALALVLVFSLFGAFVPVKQVEAQAYTPNQWNKLSTPSGGGRCLVEGSNVTDFAVAADGKTVYLVDVHDTNTWGVAKSTNGGSSFSWLFGKGITGVPAPPTGFTSAPKLVAASPDDPNAAALVETQDEVWISNNGGATWASMGVPAAGEVISDIAVSSARAEAMLGRDYVVSTYDSGTGWGDIYVVGTTATWAAEASGAGLELDFSSVALAPNWAGDRVVLAVGSDNSAGGTNEQDLAARGDSFLVAINVATHALAGPQKVRLDAAASDSPAAMGGEAKYGSYSAALTTTGTDDGSVHVEVVPTESITFADFQADINNTPVYSFWHNTPATSANWAQFELRFEDPDSTGWLEVTAVPLQGHTGSGTWAQKTLSTTTPAGFGGNTPDGSSVFDWGPLTPLSAILTDVNTAWGIAESGKAATDYVLTRVRVELWEALPNRTCYIDDITINNTIYPVEPTTATLGGNTAVGWSTVIVGAPGQIVSSSITLPADFDSTSVGGFRAYVGWTSVKSEGIILCADDAYRVDFNAVRKLEVRPTVALQSLSYFGTVGAGTLMVGEIDSTRVWFSSDPMSGMPSWGAGSAKPPTGAGNTIVAMTSETEAFAGTSGDNSGFHKSEDGGLSFNGLSFIDESIAAINDVMPSPDGSTVFIATSDSAGNDSLWRGVGFPAPGKWQRVHFQASGATPAQFDGASTLIRLSPDYDTDSTLYWFDAGTGAGRVIQRSTNSGQIFSGRTAPAVVADATIESQDILYIISGANAYTSTNGGWFFGLPTDTGTIPYSIAMVPTYPAKPIAGNVLVGSTTGSVKLSTNGAASFKSCKSVSGGSDMQVQADENFANNSILYAASNTAGQGIYRFEVGVSTAWEQIRSVAAGMTGLTMYGGYLYGSWSSVGTGTTGVAGDSFVIVNQSDSRGIDAVLTLISGKVGVTLDGCTATGLTNDELEAPGTAIVSFPYSGLGASALVEALDANSGGIWTQEYSPTLVAGIITDADGDASVAATGGAFSLPDKAGVVVLGEAASGAERSSAPFVASPVPFATMDVGSAEAAFTAAPSALRASANGTETVLWAIDTAAKKLMAYNDTMAQTAPTVLVPSEVAADPATSRNAAFTISWNRISNSTLYTIDIARDEKCTERAYRNASYRPPSGSSPEWLVPAGEAYLSAGKTYYVRVKAVDQVPGDAIDSKWSKVMSFDLEPGVPVQVSYLAPQPLGPVPGATDVPLSPGFTWSPYLDTTKYEFKLAKDAALSDTVATAMVSTTAYKCEEKLAYGTTFFWAVRSVEPAASGWSPVSSFTTEKKPVPPVVVEPTPPAEIPPSAITPGVIWAIIVIGAILVIAVIVLIVRTRRIA